MKLLIAGLALLAAGPFRCTQKEALRSIDKVSLSLHQYPTRDVLRYEVDSSGIAVHLANSGTGFDSVLYTKAASAALGQSRQGMFRFREVRYANKCLEDGQVMTLAYHAGDSTVRRVRFQNYYHDDLQQLVQFINTQVDSTYRIGYNKDALLRGMEACDK
ncbi:hypothetical protein [Flaviaesturariibacter amylovorans]|uniref:DUF4251 domain-containing protein n=1 Tax=Flaviaesturariibacter amylovorans TaxID=1084520 RepID=A0ABP8G7F8_9BACT